MNGKKAFVLVGHSNWGKSKTLRELLSSDARRQSWTEVIVNVWLFMKRMSNDDDPESLLKFVRELNPKQKPLVILALCPSFSEEPKKNKTYP